MTTKICPHCGQTDNIVATYSECQTCGRIVCLSLGCFCSDYQAQHPIRGGRGAQVWVKIDAALVGTFPHASNR